MSFHLKRAKGNSTEWHVREWFTATCSAWEQLSKSPVHNFSLILTKIWKCFKNLPLCAAFENCWPFKEIRHWIPAAFKSILKISNSFAEHHFRESNSRKLLEMWCRVLDGSWSSFFFLIFQFDGRFLNANFGSPKVSIFFCWIIFVASNIRWTFVCSVRSSQAGCAMGRESNEKNCDLNSKSGEKF